MDAQDWRDLGSVHRAGAARARSWSHNTALQQHAAILEAQADRCDEIARERDGNPPVTHEHEHYHERPDGHPGIRHRHAHAHGRGRADHQPDPVGHRHEQDLFAPSEQRPFKH
jgi:hypothetical protein